MINIEIKAKIYNPEKARNYLRNEHAEFIGIDHQIDTYFVVKKGKLKLREGNIENALIYYIREAVATPKKSEIMLYKLHKGGTLKDILLKILDVDIVVDKKREIYFIDNVKFLIDEVKGLGNFIEIEAIDENETIGDEILRRQCERYVDALGVSPSDILKNSYSDMLKEISR